VESCELYVDQSRVLERACEKELIIWDVGMGAAANAMATIRALEGAAESEKPFQPVRIVSFENDLDSLQLALRHSQKFRYLWHPAPEKLLAHQQWSSSKLPLNWELRFGDFLEQYPAAPRPDLIFFDPFSSKTGCPLWSWESFSRLREFLADGDSELYTYSSSTAVRSSLLAAGFHVAPGRGIGLRPETTVAMTSSAYRRWRAEGRLFLGLSWRERWERSDARVPVGLSSARREEFESRVRLHPQFLEPQLVESQHA
jgi:queuine tRNA-ribosyltransferase